MSLVETLTSTGKELPEFEELAGMIPEADFVYDEKHFESGIVARGRGVGEIYFIVMDMQADSEEKDSIENMVKTQKWHAVGSREAAMVLEMDKDEVEKGRTYMNQRYVLDFRPGEEGKTKVTVVYKADGEFTNNSYLSSLKAAIGWFSLFVQAANQPSPQQAKAAETAEEAPPESDTYEKQAGTRPTIELKAAGKEKEAPAQESEKEAGTSPTIELKAAQPPSQGEETAEELSPLDAIYEMAASHVTKGPREFYQGRHNQFTKRERDGEIHLCMIIGDMQAELPAEHISGVMAKLFLPEGYKAKYTGKEVLRITLNYKGTPTNDTVEAFKGNASVAAQAIEYASKAIANLKEKPKDGNS